MSHLFIFDKDENLLDLLDSECYYDDSYKRQLNGEWSFTFYVKFEHLKHLEKPNKIGFYDKEEQFQLFKIQDCEDVFGNEESFEIYCVHDSYSLGELIIEDKRIIGGTARDAIVKCIENSTYSVGDVAELGEKTLNFYFISRLQGLHNIVETYGGELDFRFELNDNKTRIVNRYVDLKYRLGEDTGLRFTFDLNLQGVTRNRSSEGHFTVLYGRGKSLEVGEGYSRRLTFDEVAWNTPTNPLDKPLGDKNLVDPDAVARFGRIEGIYENDSIEDAEELLKATHKALEDAKEPKISYSATVEDLSNLSGYEHLKFVLGDSIIIQDEKYRLNNEARIVSESYSIKNKKEPKQVTLGYIQKGISDSLSGGSITNPTITAPTDIEIDDSDFPNTLPNTPILKSKGLFSSVMLEWTFESKTYYNYEIYASKIQHFNPDSSNLIFKGKASSLLHEVKPSETWYYRARAVNTHGEVTEMSEEVSATTLKISDAAEYFEEAAIGDALIETLSFDRGWFGKLKGQFMDVKNLVVTDGNDIRTMYVDDFGRIHMNVSELKINSKDVISKEQTETLIEAKAGEISLSVAKKEVATAKSEINKTLDDYSTTAEMQATIKVVKDEINFGVSSLTETVESTTTLVQSHTQQLAQKADLTKVNEKIDGIQFGGRNYIRNGNFSNGSQYWTSLSGIVEYQGKMCAYRTMNATSGEAFITSQRITIPNLGGKQIVISFLAACTPNVRSFEVYFLGRKNGSSKDWDYAKNKFWTLTENLEKYEWAYTVPEDCDSFYVRFDNNSSSDGLNATIYITNVMIELGNKAGDWVEAPEDLKSSIDAKANSVDVYVKTEVYTKAQTDAAINIAKDEITLGVSNTYETKTNVETKVNQSKNEVKNYADSKINSIEVGWRNLLRNTDFTSISFPYGTAPYNWRHASSSGATNVTRTKHIITDNNAFPESIGGIKIVKTGTDTLSCDIAQDGVKMEDGQTYTMSFYARLDSGSGKAKLQYGTSPYFSEFKAMTSSWNKYVYTFTYDKSKLNNQLSTNIYFGIDGSTFVGYICGFKLEKGNKATDWSPAPEDVQETITSTKTEVKEYADSQINVAKNAITQSVASTYETKTNVESKVNGVKSSVTNLESRVNKAEQKITDSAIISTVQNTINTAKTEAINSANSNTANQLKNYSTTQQMNSAIDQKANEITLSVSQSYATKGEISGTYATKSELKQTSDSFTFKLENSGGYNVIKNGNALNGQAHWLSYWLPSATWGVRNDEWSGYVPCFQINNPTGANQYNIIYQSVPTVVGKTYTASALVAGHRAENYIVIVNGSGTAEISASDRAINVYGGADAKDWKRVSTTFVATESTMQIRLYSYPWGGHANNYGWFREVQIEEGTVVTNFSPNPSEVYNGITRIDSEGVHVSHTQDGSTSHMGAHGFTHFVGGTNRKYHSLMFCDSIGQTDSWGNVSMRYRLPSEFWGKKFEVLPSLVHVGFDRDVAHAFKNLNISVHDFDHANGYFSITCTPIGVDVNGSWVVNASTSRVSFIAIA